ncbi:MAG TPA: long-chain fatty acid--CoA ligase [Humidesulfovibrio sp.]|uniref:long-chain-fatty-acid--CoA ligase n=1 Tax=Humidesulfovibrio sp. TaxID=2910988 RepID=UPI002C532BEE|nr:long-chain fatty acid--CoA ligase [Humidesulfovibrio sp.]HWR02623.1 long-chain fatty acid--CoA ligase [Humidesulfovibrio sp.]
MPEIDRPWLTHYDQNVPNSPQLAVKPVFELLDDAAKRWPDRPAIVFQNTSISYSKLRKLSSLVAANLRKHGLKRGERVAIMLPNTPQTVIAYWGVLRAGGTVVFTNPLYMETEIVHQFADSGARFLITLDLLWSKIEALRPQLKIEKYFVTSIADALRFPLSMLYKLRAWREGQNRKVPFDGNQVHTWSSLLGGMATYTADGLIPEKDLALLQYTGGTTGLAKGCMITHANLCANAMQCTAMLPGMGENQELFLGVLPYFHIYGLTVCLNLCTALGATQIPFPRYVPGDVLKTIHKERPTVFPGAPSVYISLLQQKNVGTYDLSSIRYCVSGSAPMPVEWFEQFKNATGARICEGYGLSEASPVTHINPLHGVAKHGSIGLPVPGTDAKIVDMDLGGPALPPGKLGELAVRGPQVMAGYYNKPDETADVLRNGWLYTGDIAYMDEDGYFFIVDRKKDLIISAGYNIYPREIDEILHQHPKVQEAVAVGIPCDARGEVVKVFVVPKAGEKPTKAEIIAFCRQKLAGYKVPRHVEFRESLPKTMVGKVLRRALRAEEAERTKACGVAHVVDNTSAES